MRYPLVSVVIPVFNAEKYIREAVESIINQSYKNLEIIVIDDGSTDKTFDILRSIQDNRLIIKQNLVNLGTAESSNIAVKMARGEFICLMDGDDVSLSNRVYEQVSFFLKHEDYGLLGTASIFSDTKQVLRFPRDDKKIRVDMLRYYPFRNPTLMIRKDILLEHNIFFNPEYSLTLDYEFVSRVIPYTKTANLDTELLLYRVHPEQTSKVHHGVFLQSADNVRINQLANLEIVVSERERMLHLKMLNDNYIPASIAEFEESQIWIRKLKDANNKVGFYDKVEFDGFLFSLNYVHRKFVYGKSYTFDLINEFYFSSYKYYKYVNLGVTFHLKFIFKCILKWQVKV